MLFQLYRYFIERFFFGIGFCAGRNFFGRITVFHRGGGVKRRVRIIDYYRDVREFGVILSILEARGRFGYLALVCYFSGFFSLVLSVSGICLGQRVYSGQLVDNRFGFNPLVFGSAVPFSVVPIGSVVCLIELRSGFGFQLLRSAGVWGKLLKGSGNFVNVKVGSGRVFKIFSECLCVLGRVSNVNHKLDVFGKAGLVRLLGFRPVVRGEAMNPVDHPHGGRTRGGRVPVTPWGRVTKGKRTVG